VEKKIRRIALFLRKIGFARFVIPTPDITWFYPDSLTFAFSAKVDFDAIHINNPTP